MRRLASPCPLDVKEINPSFHALKSSTLYLVLVPSLVPDETPNYPMFVGVIRPAGSMPCDRVLTIPEDARPYQADSS